ncbi:carnitine O-palmitoyltransferase 1, liver isoform-like [Oratosquilla oratoria]|uniref:carnitine O-palmitoyltransferase 1, liver isoform-like n=1 Tax=Oratosquilla oratoria TaxID=337810 RepID=UPI003F759070
MAEARSAVATPRVQKEDLGTTSSWTDFFKFYRQMVLRNYFRFRNSFRNGVWPTSTNNLVVACGFSLYLLEYEPRWAERVTPMLKDAADVISLPKATPRWLKHIVTSVGISVVFFTTLMKVRQYLLRILLAYKGWMYENVREVSWKTKFWGLTVKFVSGYQPSLYSCQRSLPRLPVPPLRETMAKLLESLEPLCTEEEFNSYKDQAQEFENTIGPRLQRILHIKSWWAPNYVSDWWEKYVYQMSRCPIAINSNYYALDHYIWTPTKLQVSRAANVLHSLLFMKRQIDREELQPLLLRNTIPVCMAQYERIFSTTRMPGTEIDELLHYDSSESRHVVVWCQGLFYKLYLYDDKNQLLALSTLEKLFQGIIDDANKHKESVSESERSVSALTGLPRTEWSKIMKRHLTFGINRDNMEIINKAVCVVVLFDKPPESLVAKAKNLLHADGRTLWYDKCFNLCVFPDGQCGLNVEHTMADAPAIGHVWEYAMTMEVIEKRYLENGQVMPPPKSFKQGQFRDPRRIMWDITDELEKEIDRATKHNQEQNEDLDLEIRNHSQFGKGTIKKAKVSPDAFIQIALQLAYYKDAGRFCQTYEASATRLYQNGRTETVRSCTNATAAFVKAMESGKKSKEELIEMLRFAGNRHQKLYRDAMSGKGIDRHLFALYVVSKGLGYENKFLDSVIRRPWTLSTSQQPQQQIQANIPDINLEPFRKMCSPGGGFGPVSDDGYGVSYMLPNEYNIFFHVSSKRSSSKTDSVRFADLICQSMEEMRSLFDN